MKARSLAFAALLACALLPAGAQSPETGLAETTFADGLRRLAEREIDLLVVQVDRRSPGEPQVAYDLPPDEIPREARSFCALAGASVEEVLAAVPWVDLGGYPSVALVARGPRFAGAVALHRKDALGRTVSHTLAQVRFLVATAPREGGPALAPEQRLQRVRACARLRWWDEAAAEARAVYKAPAVGPELSAEAMFEAHDALVALERPADATDLLAQAFRECEKGKLDPCRRPFLDVLERMTLVGDAADLGTVEQRLARVAADGAVQPADARAAWLLANCLMRQGPERTADALKLVARIIAVGEEQGQPWVAYAIRLRTLLTSPEPKAGALSPADGEMPPLEPVPDPK